jgi:hypothetical protein
MCTKEYPFLANNFADLYQKIQFEEPDYPARLGDQLIDLLKKILIKNAADRYSI